MTALVAGFFLVAYLLATGAIYRLAFSYSISSKRFQRSRTEEITFSVLVTLCPYLVTWLLLCHTPIGRYPAIGGSMSKAGSYHVAFSALTIDHYQDPGIPEAFVRAGKEQVRFILWLWAFCLVEGVWAGRLIRGYGDYPDASWKRKFCNRFLLKYVSEWEILFTTLPLRSDDPRRSVEVDAMSTANILYRGKLVNWFTDSDGKLAGIFLENAMRYQHDEMARDRDNHRMRNPESYWRPIPGSKLYLTAVSVTNYNIRYVERVVGAAQVSLEELVEEEFGEGITITPLPPDSVIPRSEPHA